MDSGKKNRASASEHVLQCVHAFPRCRFTETMTQSSEDIVTVFWKTKCQSKWRKMKEEEENMPCL